MANLLSSGSDANGASSGNATTGTTGASSQLGAAASVQHSSAQKIEGVAAFLVSGAAYGVLQWNPGTHTSSYTSFYIYTDDRPSASFFLAGWRDTTNASYVADLRAGASGELQFRNSSQVQQHTYTTSLDTWYRVDWEVNVGSNQQRIRIYTGATLHSSNTADAVSDSGLVSYGGGSHGRFNIGQVTAATGTPNIYIDYLRSDDTTMPAPYTATAAGDQAIYLTTAAQMLFAQDTVNVFEGAGLRPSSAVMRFTATATFSPATSGVSTTIRWKRWNGTEWVDMTWMRWTGSFWTPLLFQSWATNPDKWIDMNA